MKIRNDFVTNSSSSSFVLGFKSKRSVEKTIEKEKEKMMSDIWLGINDRDYDMLINDCKEKGMKIDEVLKEIKWEFDERAKFEDDKRHGFNYDANYEYDPEFIKNEIEKYTEDFKRKAKDDGLNYFVYVEYADDETMLDYSLRKRPFTVEWFSHH